MSIEDNLNQRIAELESTLAYIRDSCAYNLADPGNEDDTFHSIISSVTESLHDRYTFDLEAYLDD